MMKYFLTVIIVSIFLLQCQTKKEDGQSGQYQVAGSIERLDPSISKIIPKDASLEILASGFSWSEGPLWIPELKALVFSDIPENSVYKWTESDSIQLYLKPSGYTGDTEKEKREPGSNGLILDKENRLILCQHGDRQIGRMKSELNNPLPKYEVVVENYNGLRFNSPNDIVMNSMGEFFFTDPPYGLDEWNIKELDFQGVYKITTGGEVILLIDSLSRPNGIGLSPDEKTLYVAVSDPKGAKYYSYTMDEEGRIVNGKMILDVTNMISKDRKGVPDGLAVHSSGNLFATGPGGVLVISPDGKHLGTILTGQATANCTFNEDESALYITADMHLMRLQL